MNVIKINKTFPTLEACNAWESENIIDKMLKQGGEHE